MEKHLTQTHLSWLCPWSEWLSPSLVFSTVPCGACTTFCRGGLSFPVCAMGPQSCLSEEVVPSIRHWLRREGWCCVDSAHVGSSDVGAATPTPVCRGHGYPPASVMQCSPAPWQGGPGTSHGHGPRALPAPQTRVMPVALMCAHPEQTRAREGCRTARRGASPLPPATKPHHAKRQESITLFR